MIRPLILLAGLAASPAFATDAQDSSAAPRPILFEVRVGKTEVLGEPGRRLVGPDDAIGVSASVRISPVSGAWFSMDFRPSNSSVLYPGPGMSPAVSMYALTAGVSRPFGPAIGRARVRPVDLGLGVGATRMAILWPGPSQPIEVPQDAPVEDPYSAGLLESRRWRPTAVARLRFVLPLGRARLSATAALAATPVGDVRLWNGRWERTPDGTSYRASFDTWRYGTIVAVPLTLGLGVEF